MSNRPLDESFLDSALGFASRETRHHVADALYCHLHNDGYALEGNTEANDVAWFARSIWQRINYHQANYVWDKMAEQERERYREIASAVIAVLPNYQLRIAHRLIAMSKVVRDIERAARVQGVNTIVSTAHPTLPHDSNKERT